MESKKLFWVKYGIFRVLPLALAVCSLINLIDVAIENYTIYQNMNYSNEYFSYLAFLRIYPDLSSVFNSICFVSLGVLAVLLPFEKFKRAEKALKIILLAVTSVCTVALLGELIHVILNLLVNNPFMDQNLTISVVFTTLKSFLFSPFLFILGALISEKKYPKLCRVLLIMAMISVVLSNFEAPALLLAKNVESGFGILPETSVSTIILAFISGIIGVLAHISLICCALYLPIKKTLSANTSAASSEVLL